METAFISPGSRSAPLTIAATQCGLFHCRIVVDERAAGFTALGHAQATGKPSLLICTSGTAAYNYAPAIAEAYFAQVPFLVLTADRPPEWVGQANGQTIYQDQLFGRHCKAFYKVALQADHEDAVWNLDRLANEACHQSMDSAPGPVQINMPFREPFYPKEQELHTLKEDQNPQTIALPKKQHQIPDASWEALYTEICPSFKSITRGIAMMEALDRIMIVIGQMEPNTMDWDAFQVFCEYFRPVVLADVTANVPPPIQAVRHTDLLLNKIEDGALYQPELLISFGSPLLSKKLKQFLRAHAPQMHWNLRENGQVVDTLQCMSRALPVSPDQFFNRFREDGLYDYVIKGPDGGSFAQQWMRAEEMARQYLVSSTTDTLFSELQGFRLIGDLLPGQAHVHLGNSMPVRFADLLAYGQDKPLHVHSNRGACGIDGCLSTAVGHALARPEELHVVILGDLSFFYDQNGLWQESLPHNLRIIVSNNRGGGIFRLIKGPSQTPDFERWFETPHQRKAQSIAEDYGLAYWMVENSSDMKTALRQLFKGEEVGILEFFTEGVKNEQAHKSFMDDFQLP